MRMRSLLAAVALVGVVAPADAAALGWIRLPNGNWAYQADYTSSAVFTCGNYIIVGSCTSVGNGVILSRGGSSLTLTWVPGPSTITTGFFGSKPFVFGTIEKVVTGSDPFVLPEAIRPNVPLFMFQVTPTVTGHPPSGSHPITYHYVRQSSSTLGVAGYSNITNLGFASGPPGTGRWWLHTQLPDIEVEGDDIDYLATTGLVTPEPASLALLATGLIGVAGVVGTRRRRKD